MGSHEHLQKRGPAGPEPNRSIWSRILHSTATKQTTQGHMKLISHIPILWRNKDPSKTAVSTDALSAADLFPCPPAASFRGSLWVGVGGEKQKSKFHILLVENLV